MTSDRELIRKYEPVMRFGTDKKGKPELFFPMAARDYVHTCGLRRRKVGWIQKPGSTLLTHLSDLTDEECPRSKDCYLVFAAGDVPDFPGDIVMELIDSGLELGRTLPDDDSALERMDAGGQMVPRILLGHRQADVLEARLSSQTQIERRPIVRDEFSTLFDNQGAVGANESLEAMAPALETAAANLEWVEFPSLNPLPQALRDWAVQKYTPFRDWNNFPPVYHYHVSQDSGYTVLQYWFLYPYNDWASHGGNNDHEGDWEVVYVFLDDQEQPRHVAYSKHVPIPLLVSPETAVWEDVEIVDGTHPVVYVGVGSHASYLTRGKHRFIVYVDRAKGDHLSIGPGGDQAWGEPVLLSGKAWNTEFAGPWGALIKTWFGLVLPDTKGPTSPGQKEDKWFAPAKWANIPPLR